VHKPHLRYRDQTPRERTWTIHLISLEKVLKATVLVVVGFKLLSFLGKDVHEWAVEFVARHRFAVIDRYIQPALDHLVGVGDRQLKQFSVAAFGYAGILFVEGIGLWLQKRWAEYLTAIATALFIPFEIYEISQRLTWVRCGALGINLFIVWYLVTRLRDETVEAKHLTFVKICGITNMGDAKHACRAGADAIGFNFYPKSKRYIVPERAATIARAVGRKVFKVGVFVNCPADEIREVAEMVRLDAVQLHGDEPEEVVTELRSLLPQNTQIIKAVRSGDAATDAHAIIIDAVNSEYGGSGETSDWDAAAKLVKEKKIVYLAGGLGADNVEDAIRLVHPFAVDACSRLEKSPGLKDRRKVAAFIKAAKQKI
jgi:phosphoribosylanthranilate isomerase